MDEQETDKEQKETSAPTACVELAVFDHILIVDADSGEKLVNKRG